MVDKFGDFEEVQEGPIFHFKAQTPISKGQVVKVVDGGSSFDDIKVAPASSTDTKGIVGVALEDSSDVVAVLTKYIAIIKAKAGGTISLGDAVTSGDNGTVVALADQNVNEGGTSTYTIHYARKIGEALQSAVADDYIAVGVIG